MEDAERQLELVDTEPESIDLELQDTEALEYTEALELVDIGILKDITILRIRVTSLRHFSNIVLMWRAQIQPLSWTKWWSSTLRLTTPGRMDPLKMAFDW